MGSVTIGLVIADPNELAIFLQAVRVEEDFVYGSFAFWRVTIGHHKVIVVLSGVGIPQAAAAAQCLLGRFSEISVVFNIGSAGGVATQVSRHDVIAPSKIFYEGVITPWYEYGVFPYQKVSYFTNYFTPAIIDNCKTTNLATGTKFIDSEALIANVPSELAVGIFDMEAAAICNISHNFGKPCAILKVVSDLVGVDATTSKESINTVIGQATSKVVHVFLRYLMKK